VCNDGVLKRRSSIAVLLFIIVKRHLLIPANDCVCDVAVARLSCGVFSVAGCRLAAFTSSWQPFNLAGLANGVCVPAAFSQY